MTSRQGEKVQCKRCGTLINVLLARENRGLCLSCHKYLSATKGLRWRTRRWPAVRILSWPFLFIGGIGIGTTLAPMLLTSDNDQALLRIGCDSYSEWFLRLVLAAGVFGVGLLLRWLSGRSL